MAIKNLIDVFCVEARSVCVWENAAHALLSCRLITTSTICACNLAVAMNCSANVSPLSTIDESVKLD